MLEYGPAAGTPPTNLGDPKGTVTLPMLLHFRNELTYPRFVGGGRCVHLDLAPIRMLILVVIRQIVETLGCVPEPLSVSENREIVICAWQYRRLRVGGFDDAIRRF